MTAHICAAFVAALFVAADAPDDAVKKEQEKLKGTWVVESFQLGEKTIDKLKGTTYQFNGEKLIITIPGQKGTEGTYKLDPSKNPKALDIVTPVGDGKVTSHTIYALDGDELKICSSSTTTTT